MNKMFLWNRLSRIAYLKSDPFLAGVNRETADCFFYLENNIVVPRVIGVSVFQTGVQFAVCIVQYCYNPRKNSGFRLISPLMAAWIVDRIRSLS